MGKLLSLPLTQSWDQEVRMLAGYCKQKAAAQTPLRILEAGCGRKWGLDLADTQYALTGVDLDAAALNVRMTVAKDLDEMIVGDLRTVQLPAGAFDVIFCSYVLEHIPGAERVLGNFLRWLRPDGLMIIQVPDPYSVKGFVTRVTPFWFHVFFYRRIRGVKNAGKPGHGPYPTHYDAVISRHGMREFCSRNNLTITAEFGCGWRQQGSGLTKLLLDASQRIVGFLSLGRLSSKYDDITYVIQRGSGE